MHVHNRTLCTNIRIYRAKFNHRSHSHICFHMAHTWAKKIKYTCVERAVSSWLSMCLSCNNLLRRTLRWTSLLAEATAACFDCVLWQSTTTAAAAVHSDIQRRDVHWRVCVAVCVCVVMLNANINNKKRKNKKTIDRTKIVLLTATIDDGLRLPLYLCLCLCA